MRSSRIRVLQLCSYYSSPFYELLFDALAMRGVEQKVFYPAVRCAVFDGGAGSNVVFDACYSQFDRLLFKRKSRKMLESLYGHFEIDDFDVMHAHSLFSNGILAFDAKVRFGVPYVVAVRNTDIYSFFRFRPWLRGLGIEIARHASSIVFLSHAYREMFFREIVPARHKDEFRQKSYVIPNGINRLFLDKQPSFPRKPDGMLRVLQVGDLSRNKNQLAVAKACKLLRKQGRDVEYVVIGRACEGGVAEKLKRMSNVRVMEPKTQLELVDEYRSADVFAMPSFHETFGLSYAEAMSQGLPIVYTKGQGFDGWFESEEVGACVPPSDVKQLADAIASCYGRRSLLFENNIEASRLFDWIKIARRYESIYSAISLVGRGC